MMIFVETLHICLGLFLDNTFCNPQYVFPSQSEAIRNIINIVRREVSIQINLTLLHEDDDG